LEAKGMPLAKQTVTSFFTGGVPASEWDCVPMEQVGIDPVPVHEADLKLHRKVDRGLLPGVLSMVFRKGKLCHFDAYGYADVERKVPITANTIFRLYSMTKCIVGVGFMILVERGMVGLDDPVDKLIPSFAELTVAPKEKGDAPKKLRKSITMRQLLCHVTGIGMGAALGDKPSEAEAIYQDVIDRCEAGEILTLAQWVDEIAKLPLNNPPGTGWEYGYSHDVIGRVIELVSGMPLDEFIAKEVAEPLGMKDTGFSVPQSKVDRLAAMYKRRPHAKHKKLILVDDPQCSDWVPPRNATILAGGGAVQKVKGGMVSTLNDYARFLFMLMNEGELDGVRIMKTETCRLLLSNHLPAATGRSNVFLWDTPGMGFMPIGAISIPHHKADKWQYEGEYGWGGMACTAYTVDPPDDLILLSFSHVAHDIEPEDILRKGIRRGIARFHSCETIKHYVLHSCLKHLRNDRETKARIEARGGVWSPGADKKDPDRNRETSMLVNIKLALTPLFPAATPAVEAVRPTKLRGGEVAKALASLRADEELPSTPDVLGDSTDTPKIDLTTADSAAVIAECLKLISNDNQENTKALDVLGSLRDYYVRLSDPQRAMLHEGVEQRYTRLEQGMKRYRQTDECKKYQVQKFRADEEAKRVAYRRMLKNQPRLPAKPVDIFIKEKKNEIMMANPKATTAAEIRRAGVMTWKNLTAEEKQPYEQKGVEEAQQAEIRWSLYRETDEYKGYQRRILKLEARKEKLLGKKTGTGNAEAESSDAPAPDASQAESVQAEPSQADESEPSVPMSATPDAGSEPPSKKPRVSVDPQLALVQALPDDPDDSRDSRPGSRAKTSKEAKTTPAKTSAREGKEAKPANKAPPAKEPKATPAKDPSSGKEPRATSPREPKAKDPAPAEVREASPSTSKAGGKAAESKEPKAKAAEPPKAAGKGPAKAAEAKEGKAAAKAGEKAAGKAADPKAAEKVPSKPADTKDPKAPAKAAESKPAGKDGKAPAKAPAKEPAAAKAATAKDPASARTAAPKEAPKAATPKNPAKAPAQSRPGKAPQAKPVTAITLARGAAGRTGVEMAKPKPLSRVRRTSTGLQLGLSRRHSTGALSLSAPPHRPPTAYHIFKEQEHEPQLRRRPSGMRMAEIRRSAVARWHKMTPDQRKPFETLAKRKFTVYVRSLRAFIRGPHFHELDKKTRDALLAEDAWARRSEQRSSRGKSMERARAKSMERTKRPRSLPGTMERSPERNSRPPRVSEVEPAAKRPRKSSPEEDLRVVESRSRAADARSPAARRAKSPAVKEGRARAEEEDRALSPARRRGRLDEEFAADENPPTAKKAVK